MNIKQQKEELKEKYLALDTLGAITDRVQRYNKVLLMKEGSDLTSHEKFWLLAYDGVESRLKPGTEKSLFEGGLGIVIVDMFIPKDFR